MDINRDTAVVVTKPGYLLISCHMSSKEEVYLKQTEQLRDKLNSVLNGYPKGREPTLIIGIDANHQIL